MTTRECYEAMNENYEEVLERIGSDGILRKFVIKFLEDRSYTDLVEGIREADGEKAFRAAHTLKGICLNLGFDQLYAVSAEITEKLRGRDTADVDALLKDVDRQYKNVVNAILQMTAEE